MLISDTKAIITGAASGLGEATARVFRDAGAQVVIFDRDVERGQKVAAEIGAGFTEVDVTDEASVQAGIEAAIAHMGGLNASINCAGIAPAQKIVGREGASPLADFKKVIDVNLVGTYNILRLAA
ncbi:MAG: SDR family NAD(P)-dependent oxidoreductase, partial [Halocynthiibacter sp.]